MKVHFNRPERQSAGILDDYAVRKNIDTISSRIQSLNLTSNFKTLNGDENNFDLGNFSFIKLNGGVADRIISGIKAQPDGHVLFINNIGTTNKITFLNESGLSDAVNRITTTIIGNIEIPPKHSFMIIYCSICNRWLELSHL